MTVILSDVTRKIKRALTAEELAAAEVVRRARPLRTLGSRSQTCSARWGQVAPVPSGGRPDLPGDGSWRIGAGSRGGAGPSVPSQLVGLPLVVCSLSRAEARRARHFLTVL